MNEYVANLTDQELVKKVQEAWRNMKNADTDEIRDRWAARYETLIAEAEARS